MIGADRFAVRVLGVVLAIVVVARGCGRPGLSLSDNCAAASARQV